MASPTFHLFEATWDAPVERVRFHYLYTAPVPAEGPSYASGGTPGEPGHVKLISCDVFVRGGWRDAPDWLGDEMADLLADDLADYAEGEREDMRAEMRGEAA